MSATAANPSPFGTRTVILLAVIGTLLMLGAMLMSGFGQELEQRVARTPGPTSKSATGFQALHDLLVQMPDTKVTLARTPEDLGDYAPLIVTPDRQTRAKDLNDLLEKRDGRPTIIILPKWETERDGLSSTRERRLQTSFVVTMPLDALLKDVAKVSVTRWSGKVERPVTWDDRVLAPVEEPQTLTGDGVEPWVTTPSGPVVSYVTDKNILIVSDPDIANNWGMRDVRNARGMVQVISALNDDDLSNVAFDLTLHYRPGDRNLIKLMFTPPFLAVTIALIAAAVLAGWAAAARFGPVRREKRALAFGKAALLDNIAMLTRSAGKANAGGPRYAAMLAERLGRRLHAPPRLKDGPLNDWLEARRPGWRARHDAVIDARHEADLVAAARALDEFTKEKA